MVNCIKWILKLSFIPQSYWTMYQIRNSTKFVYYKDIKKLVTDLNCVYAAPTEETALIELEQFRDKWYPQYPKNYKSWHNHWTTLFIYFKYQGAVRRLIYTTNAIEGFNSLQIILFLLF